MFPRVPRAWWRRAPACTALAALLLLAGGWWLAAPPPAPLLTAARFPHVSPRALAHLLADFSTHLQLYPHLGEWMVEEESSNYTAWRYTVSYSCGARCSGRAAVLALDEHREQHGQHERGLGAAGRHAAPHAHSVRVSHRACAPLLPVLTWPRTCEEWETDTYIVDDGTGGALMREKARASCGAGAGALWARACAGAGGAGGAGGGLRAARELHLRRLRALLAETRA